MATEARFDWIVETMDIRSGDRILEIGPGSSPSVRYLAAPLESGHVIAIDRSATAIARSTEKHAALIDSGRVRLVEAALEQVLPEDVLDDGRRFDKILAVNVNLFWTRRPTTELARIRDVLAPTGTLYLVYGYGDPADHTSASPKPLPGKLAEYLRESGFDTETRSCGDLLCITATPA
ncbi:class I SAM-dependent methyltransferase [Nocardia uniformis]|uniref:Class I SAM-dependent methyltransferase n=1 Tax=Nocardia uniformis TaxID=53432 RepID=A0A849BYS6_9NOCA|nr:class I SAM-dependent methyltransferase [Nocardia uniformis]NNH71662.1 class I SAM-dependent methyltransferase [Nocardia uniformis]